MTQEPVQEFGSSETGVVPETPEESSSATGEKAVVGAGLSFEVSLGPESVPPKPKSKMAFREIAFKGDLFF